MNSPAFQFYPGDWLSSLRVTELTLEEEGAYLRMLCFYWKHGSLPNNIGRLKKIVGKGVSDETITTVITLFRIEGDLLFHDRLEKEKNRQEERRKSKSSAGKKGMKKRWGSQKLSYNSDITEAPEPVITKNNYYEDEIEDEDEDEDENTKKDATVDKKEFDDFLSFFNESTGVNLKATTKKRDQYRLRRKTWSAEEIRKAFVNRSKDQWAIENGWDRHWESLFRNDQKIEHWINRSPPEKEPLKGTPEYYLYHEKKEREALNQQHGRT